MKRFTILCLTATATPGTASVKTAANLSHKSAQLIRIVKARAGPAMIYVSFQRQPTEVAWTLKESRVPAEAYRAGMKTEERKRVQDKFATSKDGVTSCPTPSPRHKAVVATIAFGCVIVFFTTTAC